MIDTKIHVAIRSYRRPAQVRTLKVVPFAWVYVPESQAAEYEQNYPGRIVAIPDSEDGNTSRKFNAVLDRSPCPWTVIMDDDLTHIGCYENNAIIARMRPDHIRWMICHFFQVAHELGCRLWGINQLSDPLAYRVASPFSFLSPILGPFNGHLEPELRFDESVPPKEDYDFWLQNIQRYHRALRINKYHYRHDHGRLQGGFVSQRTKEVERLSTERMIQKWGNQVFKTGGAAGAGRSSRKTNPNGNILNSLISVPISGI